MTLSGLIAETYTQSEVEFHRERAMQQYNRRPHRSRGGNRHLAWPFARHASARRHQRPAVS
jgi:hypothetical protein